MQNEEIPLVDSNRHRPWNKNNLIQAEASSPPSTIVP
jgi:hypothetical protein